MFILLEILLGVLLLESGLSHGTRTSLMYCTERPAHKAFRGTYTKDAMMFSSDPGDDDHRSEVRVEWADPASLTRGIARYSHWQKGYIVTGWRSSDETR
jgi:hypothetical protein